MYALDAVVSTRPVPVHPMYPLLPRHSVLVSAAAVWSGGGKPPLTRADAQERFGGFSQEWWPREHCVRARVRRFRGMHRNGGTSAQPSWEAWLVPASVWGTGVSVVTA